MKLVVIESPYAGEILRNTRYARECMRDSLQRGEAPIASHLLYTQPGVLDDNNPEERKLGIECGFAWGKHADLHAFYIDHGWSKGMLEALDKCKSLGQDFEVRVVHSKLVEGMRALTDSLTRLRKGQ